MITSQPEGLGRLLIFGFCLASGLATAGGGAKNPPASVAFRDGTDQIRSDFGGAYNNGANGAAVYFVANGNVVLDLTSSTRSVYLDFSNPVGTVTSAPPTGNYRVYLSNNVVAPDNTC